MFLRFDLWYDDVAVCDYAMNLWDITIFRNFKESIFRNFKESLKIDNFLLINLQEVRGCGCHGDDVGCNCSWFYGYVINL